MKLHLAQKIKSKHRQLAEFPRDTSGIPTAYLNN